MKVQLRENCSFAESQNDSGPLVVRIIKAGKGSSGTYTPQLLESSAHLWEGSLSFKNHPVDGDPTSRSFLDIVGTIGKTWYDEADEAVYGEYEPLSDYRETILELKNKLALSIFTTGTAKELSDGSVLIESFDEVDEYRSVDVVVAGGARGSLAPFMESLRKEDDRKETNMELEDLGKKLDALTELLSSSVQAQAAALEKEQEREAELVTAEQAVEHYAAASAEIDKAEITEGQKDALKAKAKTGADITEDLAREVATYKAIAESMKPAGNDQGNGPRVTKESEDFDIDSFTIKEWK